MTYFLALVSVVCLKFEDATCMQSTQ